MTRPRTPSQAKAAGDTHYAISWQEYCEHLIGIDQDADGPKLVMKLDDEGNYALVMNLEEAKLFSGHIFKLVCELSRRKVPKYKIRIIDTEGKLHELLAKLEGSPKSCITCDHYIPQGEYWDNPSCKVGGIPECSDNDGHPKWLAKLEGK